MNLSLSATPVKGLINSCRDFPGFDNDWVESAERLRIECEPDRVAVRITNSGEWKPKADDGSDTGIGLANVRRRLVLCYGEEADIEVSVANGATTVGFAIPVKRSLGDLVSA